MYAILHRNPTFGRIGIDTEFGIEFEYRYHRDHPRPSSYHHAKFGPRGPKTNFRVDRQRKPRPNRYRYRIFRIEFEYRYNMYHPRPSTYHHAKFGRRGPKTNSRVDRQRKKPGLAGIDTEFGIELEYRYHMDHPRPSTYHYAKFGPRAPKTNFRVGRQRKPGPNRYRYRIWYRIGVSIQHGPPPTVDQPPCQVWIPSTKN